MPHWSTWSADQCGQWARAGSFKVHLETGPPRAGPRRVRTCNDYDKVVSCAHRALQADEIPTKRRAWWGLDGGSRLYAR
eukprot:scaffold5314_cov64-Phaeocystis_antarctica.AAC.1